MNFAGPERKANVLESLNRPEAPPKTLKGKNMRRPGRCGDLARGHSSDTFATVIRRVGT